MIKRIALTASFAVVAAAANAQVPFLSFADNSTTTSRRVSTFIPATSSSPATSTSTFTTNGSGYTQGTGGTGITAPTALDAVLTSLSYRLVPTSGNTTLLGLGGAGSSPFNPEELNITDGGTITVSDSVLGALFSVKFDSAELDANGFGASDALGDNVIYTVLNPAVAPYIRNTVTGDAFGFSFANAIKTGNTITYSTQAQFASTPVPEPTTMVALGLGAVAMLRRRRKA